MKVRREIGNRSPFDGQLGLHRGPDRVPELRLVLDQGRQSEGVNLASKGELMIVDVLAKTAAPWNDNRSVASGERKRH
jgi:hypothetical protein